MKPLLKIILIMFLFHTIHCLSEFGDGSKRKQDKKKEKLVERIWSSCWSSAFFFPFYQSENRIIDNKDGTISLAVVTKAGNDPCIAIGIGSRETISVQYYIKKCIQGQVYRLVENDCKGAGTSDNYYGAQKFQFCPVEGGCNETTSPAHLACSTDNSLNRKLTLSNPSNSPFTNLIFNYFASRPDEIPNDFFWADGDTKINYFTQKLTTTYQQTEYNYVRCS